MRYLSVCSGIEAATQAWHPLGWTPVAFSEIEPFPSAVLAHHYPHVPNWGDMTKFEDWPDEPIDLLCGGTPCQDYSVAGQRLGMAGARGQLTLTFVEVAARYRPDWLVWENVPGVLSSNGGRDFARFLGDLSGTVIEVPVCGWSNSGIVAGIPDAFGLAWRVLDAQHVRTRRFPFAVPQRRRRVWVVAYLGDWRRAAAVLFDRESLSGHPAPRREAGQIAPTIPARSLGGGGLGTDFDCDGGLIPSVSMCLNAGAMGCIDGESETFIPVAHALRGEGFDASEDGTGRGTPLVPVAYGLSTQQEPKWAADLSPTLARPSISGGGQITAVAHPITLMQRGREDGPSIEWRQDGTANALLTPNGGRAGMGVGCIAAPVADTVTSNGDAHSGFRDENGLVATPWQVRRLVPEECEALQGFPRGFTAIPWRNKPADQCPDGPRYKALGNSWAVNVADWVGERIQMVEKL